MRKVSLLLWVVAALGGATGALAAVLGSPDPPSVRPILAAVQALVAGDVSPEQALREPARYLRQRAAEAMTAFLERGE